MPTDEQLNVLRKTLIDFGLRKSKVEEFVELYLSNLNHIDKKDEFDQVSERDLIL